MSKLVDALVSLSSFDQIVGPIDVLPSVFRSIYSLVTISQRIMFISEDKQFGEDKMACHHVYVPVTDLI